jgi:hypothetical protein|tara:strand:+ start:149 stop:370 length:222 start_codon:yes stop_codon:yes gene_type:complete
MTEFQILRNRKTGQYVTNTMKAVDGSPMLIWGEREQALTFFSNSDLNGLTQAQRIAAFCSFKGHDLIVEQATQ